MSTARPLETPRAESKTMGTTRYCRVKTIPRPTATPAGCGRRGPDRETALRQIWQRVQFINGVNTCHCAQCRRRVDCGHAAASVSSSAWAGWRRSAPPDYGAAVLPACELMLRAAAWDARAQSPGGGAAPLTGQLRPASLPND